MENIKNYLIEYSKLTTFKQKEFIESHKEREVYFDFKICDIDEDKVSVLAHDKIFSIYYSRTPLINKIRQLNRGDIFCGNGYVTFITDNFVFIELKNLK
jgi:hypothetical protein